MLTLERMLDSLVTIKRESEFERQIAFQQADSERAKAARDALAHPTDENDLNHLRAYRRVCDLLNYPLGVDVRILAVRIPILSRSLPSASYYQTS